MKSIGFVVFVATLLFATSAGYINVPGIVTMVLDMGAGASRAATEHINNPTPPRPQN